MDRLAALSLLNSEDSDERLRAARVLSTTAQPEDEPVLRLRRRSESVPWVRAAIEQALLCATAEEPPRADDQELPLGDRDRPYLEGVQVVADRLVHELRAIVGALRYWAEQEHASFKGSETERQVERIRRCLSAIELLGKASAAPRREEFDLVRLVDDEVVEFEKLGQTFVRVGPAPYLVTGDSGLVSIVIRNALSNAVEATEVLTKPIDMTWGSTPTEYWLAIFDRGRGLPKRTEALFDFGTTTKDGHVGAGLTIANQAALALGGTVHLFPEQANGTTKFEFRWPRVGDQVDATSDS